MTGQAGGEDVARGLDLLVAGVHRDQQAFGYGSAGQAGALYHGISSFRCLMKSRFCFTHRKNEVNLQQLFALSLRKNCSKKRRVF